MAKTKKMALGGMGAQPSNALQPYKPPSSGSVLRGGMGAQPPNALQPYKPPVGGPATKLGQAAATKLGQIRGRSNIPSPSVVKSPFVPPQTQRPAVQTPQQRDQQRLDQQAQQQRAADMASIGVKPLTPPPSGPVAPRGFGPPPGPNDSAKIADLKSLLNGKPVTDVKPMTGGMNQTPSPMKKGGMVSSKPKASSASSRGDGIATKGKTKGRFV